MATLIKRYANRKLYNTETSRYITLKGIAELLDRGEEVRVIDNETGDDITQIALSQILVGNQRDKEDPSDTLITQILSKGGDALYGAIRKSVDDATDGLGEFQDRFRHFVKESESIARGERPFDWTRRGDGERRSPFLSRTGSGSRADAADSASRTGSGSRADPRGSRSETPESDSRIDFDAGELARAIAREVERAAADGALPGRTEIDRLNRNLERVADAIDRLETTLRKSRP